MNQLDRIEHLKKMTIALSNSPASEYKKVMEMFKSIGEVINVLTTKNIEQQALLAEKLILEEKWRNSEAKYATVFNTSPDALFLMRGDIYIDCNIRTLEMFGCTKEDILNQSPLKFSPKLQPNGQKSSLGIKQHITATLRGQIQNFSWQHLRKDNTTFNVRIRLNKIGKDSPGLLMASLHEPRRKEK